MTQVEQNRYRRFDHWFEATTWLIAVGFAWLTYSLSGTRAAGREGWLYFIAGLFAVSATLFGRIMPPSSERGVRYSADDKVLFASITLFALITAYFYDLGVMPEPLVFAYFIPILASSTLLDEKIVLAESALALLAITFVQASSLSGGAFFNSALILRLAVFAAIASAALFMTTELRKSAERSEQLLVELSTRLDQIQVVDVIVRQLQFFSQIDKLLQRIMETVASAFGARQCGVVLIDQQTEELTLRSECCDLTSEERAALGTPESLETFRSVLREGQPLIFSIANIGHFPLKDPRLKMANLMLAPLRGRAAAIGVLFVANKRQGDFTKMELDFLEVLGGYIAMLIDSSLLFHRLSDERQAAERVTKLLVGRELKMREMKEKLSRYKNL